MECKQHCRLLGMVLYEVGTAVFNERIDKQRADIACGGEVTLTELVRDLVVASHLGTCLFKGILHILKYGIIKHAVAAIGLPTAAYAHSAAIGDVGSALRTLIHSNHLSMYGGRPPGFSLFYYLRHIKSSAKSVAADDEQQRA